MASVRSSQPPSSPASASNSEISSTQPPPAPAPAPALPASLQHQDAAIDNGIRDALERKPLLVDPFEDMNSEEYIERFSKYEADYTCRLMAKYFSDKDIYGGNVYEEKMTIDGETIKASRWHCADSYADPTQFLQQRSNCSSAPPQVDISNGKHPMKSEG
ncbi:uncharacterized protein LOC124942541 isoform X1 [Impatiens glandulifera]|uniref:uncharacterized protein LOC124942541 isoform X1 n=1 Tax=Impatiens glandulifera TaxID=253017 RepID=UPI001FB16399|nr:uncharacterized protein LOC124942541 isoform X1 [Impatiens glandulifera]